MQDSTTMPRKYDTTGCLVVYWYYQCCKTVLKTWNKDRLRICELHDQHPRLLKRPPKIREGVERSG